MLIVLAYICSVLAPVVATMTSPIDKEQEDLILRQLDTFNAFCDYFHANRLEPAEKFAALMMDTDCSSVSVQSLALPS